LLKAAVLSLLRDLIGTLLHPERTFTQLAAIGSVRHALAALLLCGGTWALLTALLFSGGHAPSVTLVPIPRSDYYFWQTLFVVPLLLGLWLVLTAVSHGVSQLAGGRGAFTTSLSVLAFAYSVPLLVLFVVPDLVVYSLFGFASLARAMRIYAPLAPLATLALTALALRVVYGLGLLRALAAALVGLTVQALLGGLLLR
jgi:hypothetical protein